MAKHEKEFDIEEFKAKYDKILNEGIETAQAVGQVAGEKLDVYFKKAKKGIGKYAKKASEKIAESKDKIEKKKAEIHEEREEERVERLREEADELMELSREAAEQAQIKYLEYAEAKNGNAGKAKDVDKEESFEDDEEDDS